MPIPTGDTTVIGILASVILACVGTLLWVIRAIVSGALVPRQTHEDTLKAIERQDERADLQAEQITKLADAVGAMKIFVDSLPRPDPRDAPGRRQR